MRFTKEQIDELQQEMEGVGYPLYFELVAIKDKTTVEKWSTWNVTSAQFVSALNAGRKVVQGITLTLNHTHTPDGEPVVWNLLDASKRVQRILEQRGWRLQAVGPITQSYADSTIFQVAIEAT